MKLNNFPSVNYTSLYESQDRREFMSKQMDYFGIKRHNVYLTERFSKISNSIEYTGLHLELVGLQLGTIISHLNLLRNWYVSCDEPYAIFCEDDIDFSSINYWNFTWDDFVANLPSNWECVQLMRIVEYVQLREAGYPVEDLFKLDLRWGRWWGSHSLMRRSYVKKLLDRYIRGYNQYHIELWVDNSSFIPVIENVLFVGAGVVYNFPMLIECGQFNSTIRNSDDLSPENNNQILSHMAVLDQWQTHGASFDIVQALKV
jgi:hypothetical protein